MKNIEGSTAELVAGRHWQIPRNPSGGDEPLYVRVYCRWPENERVIALRRRDHDAAEAQSWELHLTDDEVAELRDALDAALNVGWDGLPVASK